jgi:hypothetical protein
VIGRRVHGTLARFGLKVGPEIRQRSDHVKAFAAGTWVGVSAPGSLAHREIRVLKDRVIELLQEETLRGTTRSTGSILPGPSTLPGYEMGHGMALGPSDLGS